MHNIQFLTALLKKDWLVETNFALSSGHLIASLLNTQTSINPHLPDPLTSFAINAKDVLGSKHSSNNGFDAAPADSVAVISIKGVMMKEDMTCGPAGTATLGSMIQYADSHPNITSIVLHIDSPGGTVDGTEALHNIVKSVKKPVVAFVDGMMASAALWVGSAANEIIASTDTDMIGSCGVVMNFVDAQPYYESKGYKFHTVTASTSPDKVKKMQELQAGNYESYIKDFLDPIDEKFMNTLKENFPNVTYQHLTGKIFFAKDVMGIFVNSIGTLSDAIARAYELANVTPENIIPNLNNTSNMKQFTNLNAVLGLEALESVDNSVSLNEEQLNLIDSSLALNEQAITDARTLAETERDTANASLATAQDLLANAFLSFDAIDESIASATTPELKSEAIRTLLAAKPAVAVLATLEIADPLQTVKGEEDWETINKLPHNIAVDEN